MVLVNQTSGLEQSKSEAYIQLQKLQHLFLKLIIHFGLNISVSSRLINGRNDTKKVAVKMDHATQSESSMQIADHKVQLFYHI